MVGTAGQRPVSAFTRPEATAAWSAAKSRSFWSAYVSANEAIARSKCIRLAEVRADRDPIARACVGARERPAADLPVRGQAGRSQRLDHQ